HADLQLPTPGRGRLGAVCAGRLLRALRAAGRPLRFRERRGPPAGRVPARRWAAGPAGGPRAPRAPGPFDPFFRARAERSPDRAEAALHLITFDVLAERTRADLLTQWLAANTAGLVGCGCGSDAVAAAAAVTMRFNVS